jgi:hypothetical protein
MTKRMWIAVPLLGALAAPTAAQAAGTVVGGPVKVRNYSMTLIGTDAGSKDSLTVIFQRNSGKSGQTHSYTFAKGVKVTKTSISGSLGRFGSINLRLRDARSIKSKKLPKGCTGSAGKTKVGTLRGKFRLVADTTYFRTVNAKKLNGLWSGSSKLRCTGSGGTGTGGDGSGDGDGDAREPMLTHSRTDGAAMFSFTATRNTQIALRTEDPALTAPAQVIHMISATGPSLAVGAGGATATVQSVSPFIAGQGTFTAGFAAGPTVTGTLAGDLVARFDSIGSMTVSGDALLMNPS